MLRAISFTILVFSATVTPVSGQEFYVVGGSGVTLRAPGWYYAQSTQSAPGASTTSSFGGGAGVWLSPRFGIEGAIGRTTAQSIDWFYGYQFDDTGGKVTDDHDVPLTGLFRIAPFRNRAASLEPVIGGGITFHRGATSTTSDCGFGGVPSSTCVTISPPKPGEVWTSVEPLLTFGVDVAFRASRRVAIAPGFRGNYAWRPVYMTGYDFRGPYSGGGYFWTVGVTVRYSVR